MCFCWIELAYNVVQLRVIVTYGLHKVREIFFVKWTTFNFLRWIRLLDNFFHFPVAPYAKSGLIRLNVEVSMTHTIKNTHPVGLLWKTGHFFVEAATYTTQHNQHNRQERQISIFTAGLELAVPAITWMQMYALDRTATAIEEWVELDGDIWPSGRLDGWVYMCRYVCLLM
jgi:hypothetical protein